MDTKVRRVWQGWDGSTCRYRYRGAFCAHSGVQGRHCLGEEACGLIAHERQATAHRSDCSMEQWFGLYCAKYQRFYCAGKENCETHESYLRHLTANRQSQWRP